MKLPFNIILGPLIKPHLGQTKTLCQLPMFVMSIAYTYFYATLGLLISANHLKKHLGESEIPKLLSKTSIASFSDIDHDSTNMMLRDIKIIATSMGLVQYACLLVGCFTENPALFLPHLSGQLIIVAVKMLNVVSLLAQFKLKPISRLRYKIPAIIMMAFNWLQEFCVFRQYLCICDL